MKRDAVEPEHFKQGDPVESFTGAQEFTGIAENRRRELLPVGPAENPPIIPIKADVTHEGGQDGAVIRYALWLWPPFFKKDTPEAFVLEAGGMQGEVVTGRKGRIGLQLNVSGQAGHAAFATADKASMLPRRTWIRIFLLDKYVWYGIIIA